VTTEPTLLYVVGAAKAGTSWLYRYFRSHPECHFRSLKELHFFDTVAAGAVDPRRERLSVRLKTLEQQFVKAKTQRLVELGTEIADINAWLDVLGYQGDRTEAYLAYLHGGVEDEKVIGDVTPSYSLMSVEDLQTMASLNPDTRFIYIMRDPVERLWSHVRMEVARRNPTADVEFRAARKLLRGVLAGNEPEIASRGDYSAAVEKLKAAADPDRVLLAFTEEMFSVSGIRKICSFLGIGYVAPEFGRRVHKGTELALRPSRRKEAYDWLAPQYDYVEQLFGRLPRGWQSEVANA